LTFIEPEELFKAFGWAAFMSIRLTERKPQDERRPISRGKKLKELGLLLRICCSPQNRKESGIDVSHSLELLELGSRTYLNEHFLEFQKSAVTALKRFIDGPSFNPSTDRDMVATCRSFITSNVALKHNFKIGVMKTWEKVPEEPPDDESIDSGLVLLLNKVANRPCSMH
jgi:hypothetical protein